jgi:alkylation response protein AidB-like acyl-CoA dehydrogenase
MPVGVPTRDELVERAAALCPLLERYAGQAEADRQLPDEDIRALEEAGLFRLMVPQRYGGYETGIRTFLETSAQLARGCGSSSWVMTLHNGCAWLVGLFGSRAQDEVWAATGPDTRAAAVFPPTAETRRGTRGWVVSGRWAYASGCLSARWVLGGVPITDEGGEYVERGLALMPVEDVTIEDTWFMAGMKGTGSNTMVADEVFVPEHRMISVDRAVAGQTATEHKNEALYRSAIIPYLAIILAGPVLGLASAALEYVLDEAPKRPITHTTYATQTESVTWATDVTRASMQIDSAYLHAFRAAADIEGAAERGELLDPLRRARVRADGAWVARLCRQAIDDLMTLYGTASLHDSNKLQRIWRDLNVCSRQAIFQPSSALEIYARELVGLEPQVAHLL